MPLLSCVFVEEVVMIVIFLGTFPIVKSLLTLTSITETTGASIVSVCFLRLRFVFMIKIVLTVCVSGGSSSVVLSSDSHILKDGVGCCDLFEVLFIVRFRFT